MFLKDQPISEKTSELLSPLLAKGVGLKIVELPEGNPIHLAVYGGKTSHFYFLDTFDKNQVEFVNKCVWDALQ